MSTATQFPVTGMGDDDALALLPRTPVREYQKNQTIYERKDRSDTLYLVIDGRVKVSRLAGDGAEVVVDFYHRDEFFGDGGFSALGPRGETAVAIEKTSLMQWHIAELERLMTRTPALGRALLRVLAQKLRDAQRRLESFCVDPIHRRLAKTLLDLARRSGRQEADNLVHLAPTTHEQLARYVGTSREIVTQSMNRFRRDRLLKYSRRGMELDLTALERYLGAS